MAVLFTITLNAGVSAQQGPSQQSERSLICYLSHRALDLLEQTNSGNLLDQNHVVVGSFSYTPTAPQ